MRRRFRQIAALLAAIVGMAAATGALAESPAPTVMLFVDSSGSMWARLDPEHRAKIDIVRDKLTSLLEMPSSAKIGLVAVGHRRRGDCKDVEVIARPGDERDGMVQRLAKLNPIGPGPITAGLKAAVDAIGDTRPAQIVMVGDGADNCRQDPCQFASDLAKTSPGITIQVIEIGVSAADRDRVACIAEATGGHYHDITDSDGLKAALDEAYKIAIRSPDVSPAASANNSQAPPPPPAGASFSASASLADGGPLLQVPIRWRIYKSGNDTVLGESKGRGISAKVPPGSYDIEAQLGSLSARRTVTIEAGKPQSIVVPLDGGHLLVRTVSAKGSGASPTAVLTIASGDKTIAIARGGTADLYLPPSSYTVDVADGLAHASQSVTLAAGDDKPIDIALGTGRLEITAASADGALISDILYSIFEDDPESPDGRREIARSRAPQASFTLPAGTYYVSARSGGASTQERVAVGTGDTLQRTLSLPRASLKVTAVVAGVPANASQGILYTVHRLDGRGDRIPPSMGPELETALPPGQYRVAASLPADHLSASQDVTLEAGKPTALQLQVQASEVTFRLPTGSTTLTGDLFWKVTGEDGKRIRRATGTGATMLLAPGHYTVEVDARGKHKTAAFDARPGEKQQIEIDPG
jgi:Ca-activated chloride channel family protein